ncbi:RanBD1 domain-containing protein [Mycena kentingensis (nom. inval.)]|nr:RanBD1 domain-containing protein [Mycena kentingensis (nom. inval.)]
MLSDSLNAVFCGIAAFSATVGYAVARKIRPLPARARVPGMSSDMHMQSSPSPIDSDTSTKFEPEPDVDADPNLGTLKRKRDADEGDDLSQDLDYPMNLYSIYPNKRRGGSVSEHEDQEEAEAEHPEPKSEEVAQPKSNTDKETEAVEVTPEENPRSATPVAEHPTTPPVSIAQPQPQTPRFVFAQTTTSPGFGFAQFSSPRSSTPSNAAASTAFSTFAAGGSSSPFFATASAFSANSTSTSASAKKPIWATTSNDVAANAEEPALALPTPASTPIPSTTGEEDESALLSLRGLNLFVKRGDASFSGSVGGTLRLLANKESGAKRLLFRREPLWQVAMNVRVHEHGALRCTYDEREGVLRVILKELVAAEAEGKAGPGTPQTVIYAFKPGRTCRRSEFVSFAEALVVQARQGGQDPVSVAVPDVESNSDS